MSCQIKNGKYYAPNGKPSTLHKQLLGEVSQEQADDIFVLAYSDEFKKLHRDIDYDQNGEPKFRKVIDFARNKNEVEESLTVDEQIEILKSFPEITNTIELQKKLEDAFYNKGFFSPSKKSLEQSGLYLPSEIEIIMSDLQEQIKIKQTIEKLKRTDVVENEVFSKNPLYSIELNSLGKYKVFEEEMLDVLPKIQIINEQGENLKNKFTYVELVKTVSNDQNVFDALDVIEESYEDMDISKIQLKLKSWLLNYGINIDRLKLTKDTIPYLRDFLINVTEETLETLSEVIGTPHTSRQKELDIKNTKRDLVYLETLKSEEQLFEELNLIQTETPNVYHRVEKVDMQELKDYLKNENQFVKEHELYKEYFGYKNVEKEFKTLTPTQLETDVNYLKKDFVSDFYIESLKNTNDFYNIFEINETGIRLKSEKDLPKVLSYVLEGQEKLINELVDYSIISKHLPNLKSVENKDINNRNHLLNNSHLIKENKYEIINIDNNSLFLKNATEEIIKIGNNIYELKGTEGNKSLYNKVEFQQNVNYFSEHKETDDYMQKISIPTPQIEQYNKINKFKDINSKQFKC